MNKRSISPVKKGETVKVVGMAPADECEQEMFVKIDARWRYLGDTVDSAKCDTGRCSDAAGVSVALPAFAGSRTGITGSIRAMNLGKLWE